MSTEFSAKCMNPTCWWSDLIWSRDDSRSDLKCDKRTATSPLDRTNAATVLADHMWRPPKFSAPHIWCPCTVRKPPQNNYVPLQRETPSPTTNMGIWQHGNSFEEFLKIEGMPILGFMLSIVNQHGCWLQSHMLFSSYPKLGHSIVKYDFLQYCSPKVWWQQPLEGIF